MLCTTATNRPQYQRRVSQERTVSVALADFSCSHVFFFLKRTAKLFVPVSSRQPQLRRLFLFFLCLCLCCCFGRLLRLCLCCSFCFGLGLGLRCSGSQRVPQTLVDTRSFLGLARLLLLLLSLFSLLALLVVLVVLLLLVVALVVLLTFFLLLVFLVLLLFLVFALLFLFCLFVLLVFLFFLLLLPFSFLLRCFPFASLLWLLRPVRDDIILALQIQQYGGFDRRNNLLSELGGARHCSCSRLRTWFEALP